MFEFEAGLIEKVHNVIREEMVASDSLGGRVERLVRQAKMNVEILDDDHGKAILVFTVVTLVFLPLSFVASFMGMNTVDIRNQTTGQSLFWAVAIPVTLVVVGLSGLLGVQYDFIQEWIHRFRGDTKGVQV